MGIITLFIEFVTMRANELKTIKDFQQPVAIEVTGSRSRQPMINLVPSPLQNAVLLTMLTNKNIMPSQLNSQQYNQG